MEGQPDSREDRSSTQASVPSPTSPSTSETPFIEHHFTSAPSSSSTSTSVYTGDYDPVHDFPAGYPKVAAFLDCDPSFLIYRKFGVLHNNVLLDLQDELQYLEERLKAHNDWEKDQGNTLRLISRRADYEGKNSRKQLITEIKQKLDEYDNLLLRWQNVQAIKRPTKRYQNSVYNFIHEEQNIILSEQDWILRRDDLAAIAVDAEHGWLNGFIEDALNAISRRLVKKLFQNKEQRIRSANTPLFNLISSERMDILVQSIFTILAPVLLLTPVVILFELQPTTRSELRRKGIFQLTTILFFTVLFSATCSVFTKAKRQEIFQATAAYAAVLVIFLGNTSNQNLVG